MSQKTSEAGRRGKEVRSDCWISLKLNESGNLQISLKSKVDAMYGASIRRLAEDMCKHFGICHAEIAIEDSGALPFTLAARLETAVRRIVPDVSEFLPERNPACTLEQNPPRRDRFRRSRLYLPGNEPKFMINAGLYGADGVILDLEDSVAPSEKDSARILVRNALCQIDFRLSERMVRINQLPKGLEDLSLIVPQNVHTILIPKCERADEVRAVDEYIQDIQAKTGMMKPVFLMPIIESALGVLNALKIATASPNVVALTIGLEDYTADIGCARTSEGRESLWARSMIVNAARATGISPIDSVFSDIADLEALRLSVLEAKSLGFEGKGCIHPRQIEVIHDAFAPTETEISRAKQIVIAFEKGLKEGSGVVTLGSKMIDSPVVKRAQRTIALSIAMGLLASDWQDNEALTSK